MMSLESIKAAIPHREPFLLVDEIVQQSDNRIVCRKRFTGEEFWYRGHYPEFPLTPGVLLCEAAMQAGAVLLASRVGRVRETHQDSADGGSRISPQDSAEGGSRISTQQDSADGGSRISTHHDSTEGGSRISTHQDSAEAEGGSRISPQQGSAEADGGSRISPQKDSAEGGSRISPHPTTSEGQGGFPVATRMNNVKFKGMVRPGDTVDLEVELVERMAGAFFLNAKVTVGGKTAVTFDFACKMAQPN